MGSQLETHGIVTANVADSLVRVLPAKALSLSRLPGLEVDEDDNHLAIGLTTDGFDQPIEIYENLSLIVKVV